MLNILTILKKLNILIEVLHLGQKKNKQELQYGLRSEASCPLKLKGHVPPQIFEPSGFLIQLPKDKKEPKHIFIFDTITLAWLDRSVRQITSY